MLLKARSRIEEPDPPQSTEATLIEVVDQEIETNTSIAA